MVSVIHLPTAMKQAPYLQYELVLITSNPSAPVCFAALGISSCPHQFPMKSAPLKSIP